VSAAGHHEIEVHPHSRCIWLPHNLRTFRCQTEATDSYCQILGKPVVKVFTCTELAEGAACTRRLPKHILLQVKEASTYDKVWYR
jgi:hypothetical protein